MKDFIRPINKDMAEQVTGARPPRSFILDASVLTYEEETKIIREDIKQNKIVFKFPDGVNELDLLEECRALTMLDDFDTMFDIMMQMTVGKVVSIHIKDARGGLHEVCLMAITDWEQNLRGFDFINDYPIVITWLTEFLAGMLLKKYPEPGNIQLPQQAPKDQKPAKGKFGHR